ncbi:MAG: hypothetical protein J3K34DRAFT_430676, partial [Monoraphidium minutum]
MLFVSVRLAIGRASLRVGAACFRGQGFWRPAAPQGARGRARAAGPAAGRRWRVETGIIENGGGAGGAAWAPGPDVAAAAAGSLRTLVESRRPGFEARAPHPRAVCSGLLAWPRRACPPMRGPRRRSAPCRAQSHPKAAKTGGRGGAGGRALARRPSSFSWRKAGV